MTVSYVPGSGGGGGGGGDASAANQVVGNNLLTSIDSKSGYLSKDFAPFYSGTAETGQIPSIDPGGNLLTRGTVLTDEGTFRCNFANTSLAVAVGTVSIVGAVVTGIGFLDTDVHYKDYFKLDADGESAWVAIESIDCDTQLTLRTAYVGGTSGAASRALMRPVTGSGGSITVASGQCTITTGTTANAVTRITRDVDYAPMVYRGRTSVSQRIANQITRIGYSESFTTADRWFARFRIEGTTNTTVICETGRNPTVTPSVAETESTTVTIPNGATSAAINEYRVEMLTEKVAFFINGVLVALHTRSIPAQHDEMEASVTCINGAVAPASSTTLVVDYVTGKNHNKLEVGVMSDVEQIVTTTKPLELVYTNSTAGVIVINTDLTILDCSQYRSMLIQCASMGTTGVVTVQFSNDLVNWVNVNYCSANNVLAATISGANLYSVNIAARYMRLRMTTATTAGTTAFTVYGSQSPALSTATTVQGSLTANASTARIGYVAGHGVWYDDSAVVLAAAATFTGTSRDVVALTTGTFFNVSGTMAKELRTSAESDQTGTLWLEVSRDNTNWRRIKSVATAAVTGGGFFAEIVHRPSWRYARVGFTNGATLQTRFTIGSILMAA